MQNETQAAEPILFILSLGADPSQELQDLAKATVGAEKYHQVAMGQGQAEVAMQLLHECATNGEWLCLKNLHLVTAWLPTLEKVIKGLNPHKDFRLWMTAEVHLKFPTILLQSSLKITFEAPPGIKKNLLRTFESWSPDYVSKSGNVIRSQALFALAWFHAVVQERRIFIPQGWTKFYEFGWSDLRSSAEIIDGLCARSGRGAIPWEFVHGLLELAIYGGRVDNPFDNRVLVSYLKQCFNTDIINEVNKGSKKLGPLTVPTSTQYRDFIDAIEALPESDTPSYFGLPENIDRSSQKMASSAVITQLKILKRADTRAAKFDRDIWAAELTPILTLWKKLNTGQTLIHAKVSPLPGGKRGGTDSSPVQSFIHLERYNAIKAVQFVHLSLASLSKVLRGTQLLTSDVQTVGSALINLETPMSWLEKCDGPEDPVNYLRGLVSRAVAIQTWVEKAEQGRLLTETLDLSELFHPDTFLNALRQQTAREMKCSMDSLKFACSWSGGVHGSKTNVKIGRLQLEGCSFDGSRLSENLRDSPTVSEIPPCVIAWISKDSPNIYGEKDAISIPLYYSSDRDRLITRMDIPCSGSQSQWLQCGAALFLRSH
jgi:dynein heavy chain 2